MLRPFESKREREEWERDRDTQEVDVPEDGGGGRQRADTSNRRLELPVGHVRDLATFKYLEVEDLEFGDSSLTDIPYWGDR